TRISGELVGEHTTWFDFLPGYHQLEAFLSHYLARQWRWQVFQETQFTLSHVAGSVVVCAFLFLAAVRFRRSLATVEGRLVPPAQFGIRNLFEVGTEALLKTMEQIMGAKNAARFLPLVGTLAFFILFSNLLGLVPGFVPPTSTLKTNVA